MKVLVIEDHTDLADNIRDYLVKEGNVCEVSHTFRDAQDKLASFEYDCLVLDIMLPDGSGLDLLKFVKEQKLKCGILIISAKNSLDDKIFGLDLGADDYITKPFHLPELNARLNAIFRRKNLDGDYLVVFEEIEVNTATFTVKINGNLLELTKKEFDLLLYFLTNKQRVITRQSIAEHLWGDFTDNYDNFDFVYQHVKNLRKKIGQFTSKEYFHTVYGLGYKLTAAKE